MRKSAEYDVPQQNQAENGNLLPPRLWWVAIRPKTLPLAIAPVLVGFALALSDGASFQPDLFILTVTSAVLIQIGTNLFNDAKDAETGNDGPDRLGPLRVTANELASARQVKNSAILCFVMAFLGGMYLVVQGGIPILAIGLLALLAGWAYSGGPRPLSHTPWGEVFVVLFFGLAAVGGSYFLQAGSISGDAFVVGLALGLQAAAVLIMNNIRDIEADAEAGRRTLALVMGRRRAITVYSIFMLIPFALLVFAPGAARVGPGWLALPMATWLAWRCASLVPGPAMNKQLALTAFAQLLLGSLLSIGLLIDVY